MFSHKWYLKRLMSKEKSQSVATGRVEKREQKEAG
jgi:hypothetical protein